MLLALHALALSRCEFAPDAFGHAVVPAGHLHLASHAFSDCDALSSVSLPAGLRSIGAGAFRGCGRLASASLPDSLSEIGAYAFYGSGLAAVVVPAVTPPPSRTPSASAALRGSLAAHSRRSRCAVGAGTGAPSGSPFGPLGAPNASAVFPAVLPAAKRGGGGRGVGGRVRVGIGHTEGPLVERVAESTEELEALQAEASREMVQAIEDDAIELEDL